MADTIDPDVVVSWLEDDPPAVFDSFERVKDEDSQMNVRVRSGPTAVNVVQPAAADHLVLGAELTISGDMFEAIAEQRNRFLGEVGAVLTNSPGTYNVDHESDQLSIAFRHWIFADGLTNHRLVDDIIGMMNATRYCMETAKRLQNEPALR